MKATIDLEKVYDKVIYNIFSKIDGAEDLQKLIKTRNIEQLAIIGKQKVDEWVEKIMINNMVLKHCTYLTPLFVCFGIMINNMVLKLI